MIFIFPKCVLAFAIISICHSNHIEKHPARVLISEDRSAEDSFTIHIESNGEIRKLIVAPIENVWAKGAKLYTLKSTISGKQYAESSDILEDIKVYHDSQTGAVLSIKDGNINGIVDSEFTIKSEKGNHYMLKSSKEQNKKYDTKRVPHNLPSTLKKRKVDRDNVDDTLEVPSDLRKFYKLGTPIYTAEVVVFVDSDLAFKLGSDSQIFNYLIIFWNAVNRRYKTIKNPKIVIRLVGAVITRTEEDEPYITDNIISGDKIPGNKTLEDFSVYVGNNQNIIPPHDMAYLQTGRNMVDDQGDDSLGGLCYLASICLKYSPSYATGMGEDTEACYLDVYIAAHEVAHNLGADHDGDPSSGTGGCPFSDGHIMSYEDGTINKLSFSSCSISNMTAYLSSADGICTTTNITNPSIAANFSNAALPGAVLSMDEQCKCITGSESAHVDSTVTPESSLCYNLICEYSDGTELWTLETQAVAGEGAKCPSGKHCYDGTCV